MDDWSFCGNCNIGLGRYNKQGSSIAVILSTVEVAVAVPTARSKPRKGGGNNTFCNIFISHVTAAQVQKYLLTPKQQKNAPTTLDRVRNRKLEDRHLEECKLTPTLEFDLLTSNKMRDQNLSCIIHLLSLVMICPVVFTRAKLC